ncbi:hypothetical protein BH11PAT1_BH11PAT1_5020 [soil metagenome]
MDRTQQQPTDVVGQSSVPAPTTAPQPPVQSPPQQSGPAPIAPRPDVPLVGSVAKEQSPLAPISEFVKPAEHTEQQVEISKEMAEVGVEQTPQMEHPRLTFEDTKAGLEVAKAAVPISQVTGTNVTFPYTQEKAEALQKTEPISNSMRWLVESVLYHIKKAHAVITQKKS